MTDTKKSNGNNDQNLESEFASAARIVKLGMSDNPADDQAYHRLAEVASEIWNLPESKRNESDEEILNGYDFVNDKMLDIYHLAGAMRFNESVRKYLPESKINDGLALAYRILKSVERNDCDYTTEEFFNLMDHARTNGLDISSVMMESGCHVLDDVIDLFDASDSQDVTDAIRFDSAFMAGSSRLTSEAASHWFFAARYSSLDNSDVLEAV